VHYVWFRSSEDLDVSEFEKAERQSEREREGELVEWAMKESESIGTTSIIVS
jgi:hypothetical protein